MHSKQYVYTCIGAKLPESTYNFFMFVTLVSIIYKRQMSISTYPD